MLGRRATGVTSYAGTTLASQRSAGVQVGILVDGDDAWRRSPVGKLLSAVRLGPRSISPFHDGYRARDPFREAHVHFTLYLRSMVLRVSGFFGVVHWTYTVPLCVEGWRNIYTVHEVIPLNASMGSSVGPVRLRRTLDRIVASGDRLVTVSDAARADIVARIGCEEIMAVNGS